MAQATWDDLEQAIWIVQQADGTWAVVCAACQRGLYRGWSHRHAHRIADTHHC